MTGPHPIAVEVAHREVASENETPEERLARMLPIEVTWEKKLDTGGFERHTETFLADATKVSKVTFMRVMAVEGTQDMSPVFKIFEQTMGTIEYRRFIDFIEHPDHQVDDEQFMVMMSQVVEAHAALPTQPSAS